MFNVPPDAIYLLPCEPYQWVLPRVWTLSLLIGLFVSLHKNRRYPLIATALSFLITTSLWASYGARIALPRYSDVTPSDIQDSSLMPELALELPRAITLKQSAYSEPIPDVAEYRLDLQVKNMLSGKVSMTLDEPFSDTPEFTLFRGYKVKKINNAEGKTLNFSQKGDHLTILTPGQEHTKKFVFEYAGSGWGNYANYQGIFLPGSFPWYPWPGRQTFYWQDDRFDINVSSYMPRRGTVKKMQVKIESTFSKVLTPQGVAIRKSGSYTPVPSESLTLMAGEVQAIGDKETFMVYGGTSTLAVFGHPQSGDINIADKQIRQQILEQTYELRQKMGFKNPNALNVRTIIIVPTYPRYNNLYDMPVYQDGSILIAGDTVYDYAVILALQDIPQAYEKREVYECLTRYFTSDDLPGETGSLFIDLIQTKGEDYTIRAVTKYLIDESRTESGKEFLASLGSEQNESR
jgi:hypothetical protein